MKPINCEVKLMLTYVNKCCYLEGDRETTFEISDTKLYVSVVTL